MLSEKENDPRTPHNRNTGRYPSPLNCNRLRLRGNPKQLRICRVWLGICIHLIWICNSV